MDRIERRPQAGIMRHRLAHTNDSVGLAGDASVLGADGNALCGPNGTAIVARIRYMMCARDAFRAAS